VNSDSRFEIVSGHCGVLYLNWSSSPEIITILRDPIERAISHINHIQRDGGHPLNKLARDHRSIKSFCSHPYLRRAVDNLQSRYLSMLTLARVVVPGFGKELTVGERNFAFEQSMFDLDNSNAGLHDAAVAAVDACKFVGISEHFDLSIRLLARILEWKGQIPEIRLNVAPGNQKSVSTLTPQELDIINSCVKVDIQVRNHALKRLEQECRVNNLWKK